MPIFLAIFVLSVLLLISGSFTLSWDWMTLGRRGGSTELLIRLVGSDALVLLLELTPQTLRPATGAVVYSFFFSGG